MTLFVNALTQLDVSLWCPKRGLIGASWHIDAELDGELGEDGMLFDFGEVKPWIKSRLDAGADHTLLIPTRAPGITVHECNEGLCIRAQSPYPMEVRGPRQAFTLLPWSEITTERLGTHFSHELMRRPPARVSDIRLTLREENIDGEAYSYSHGLKRHTGNCQRIAHGHRSRLHIWKNGQRDAQLEAQWAKWLADRYLVDEEDLVADANDEVYGSLTTRYQAPQGRFFLRLPSERFAVLPSPTTIEHIATWLAAKIAHDIGHRIRVQAFEGINKGAIAEARP
ncbi:hypothetical protein L861_04340 [Litchfieldella anticariensis FP35 = DSM 16096]|uniref:6-carboxy-5,6,7,8-tetrahydropterin synthase n=1 Tax=Litchfieldella anticariensis (strain DSM 16096 / CECT 5854 / CIP 108499 / LMG 22089 / FP35) TaxID=1121939 RepID=S2KVD0_LITA3|nr:6-carboxytetrahydropterin synthase [Halomonas anticariensis]EPC04558.1 hypothetical protein L861_04340 [Halomonas anticariensis FP35 = DSM 16096]